ncbi:efflux RND transporter periplasmic adaptor subunit [Pseudomonas alliivorans]|uniref:efflux RND transporter periplasmic adaptor subunit n=1 Tax=Pseudomonas alliivorans TaxID=2810613 RepID=UPI001AE45534|nr:efflux RND transporter periplasmic adaptor subunit [Pseudomonas alliivorans]MBP0940328.1 efflux RND transporter periplasmic adaptor subunit [Pseudomonas alliivorans]MEE4877719.1 efflux RND transporter periplasmic adaptor subunit [Pseudomonas alliivorans]MEE4929302.1 efflux RND transporter periplasmic adaptor subunit [Pseudomonas alliivorans]MEE4934717.1 efflux RND transporter periplasmic adaptor subunit [Pseudomonas alliivorans]MEE4939849.1 efflux RND transporter periplasmic adaptor subunit
MDNKRSIGIALAVVVIIGLGSLTVNPGLLPFSAQAESDKHANESADAHAGEEAHADEEHGEDSHGSEPEQHGAAKAAAAHEEEEGHLELSAEQIKAAGIELVAAESRPMSTSVTFPGEIRFDEDRTAHVVPRVGGVVESVKVELGQSVKKGQVLAVIASQQISDQRSELSAAQRRQELARLTLQREKKLWEDRISAEQDYQQARQAFQEADISLSNARQKLSAIGASVSPTAGNRYELIAPFDAMVVEKHLAIGEVVSDASNAFTLSDLSRVWATFGVAPKDLDKVIVGRPVTVSAPDLNARVEGRIGYVGSLLGEQTRAATVRVTLANPNGAWRPGLFVSVDVAAEQSQVAVSLPESAIQTVEDKPSVFVRNDEGFQLTPVTLGRSDGGYVEIVQGLAAGTQVAATGSFILKSELGKGSAEHAH